VTDAGLVSVGASQRGAAALAASGVGALPSTSSVGAGGGSAETEDARRARRLAAREARKKWLADTVRSFVPVFNSYQRPFSLTFFGCF
jgi:hypothetical protein